MDLRTTYLRQKLRNPLVAAASPMSQSVSGVRAMEDAGISAVVLFSLFEEQLTDKDFHRFLQAGGDYQRALEFAAERPRLQMDPIAYLKHLQACKTAVDIPIIASLNGTPQSRWARYAKLVEQAGADALELNLYAVPTDAHRSGAEIERAYISTVASIRNAVKIPISVKLAPFFTNMVHIAHGIEQAMANGLVLFNRFYQPDVDVQEIVVRTNLVLSSPEAQRLPLRWIAILRDQSQLNLAATGGIHQAEDAVKMILVGADVTMLCSAMLKKGIGVVRKIEAGLKEWMEEHEMENLEAFRGRLSAGKLNDADAFERAQYVRTLDSWGI